MRLRFAFYSCGLLVLPLLLCAPAGAAPTTETVHGQFAQKDATIADLRRQIAALTAQVTALKAQAGASEVNAPNADGMTPLMLAIQNHNLERTELLLAQGADVSALDKGGNTALYWAKRPYPGVPDGARDATVAVLESAGGKE